jgi:hypothetical protein
MTNPKVQTVSINGNRHYKHPNIKNMVAPSVTSIVGMLPMPYLPKWNSKVTAEAAINEREHIDSLLGGAGGKVKAIDWLKAAAERELNKAADTGTRVHEAIEQLILDPNYKYDDDLLPFLHGFWEFEKRFEPEWIHVEKSIFSITHNYAGSFDAICKINDKKILLDFKTTRSGISAKVALQLAAYANADVIFDRDNEIPMPKVDGGAALLLRPDKWSYQPLRIDDDIFATFLALRRTFEWESRQSKTAMLAPIQHKGLM